MINGLLVYTLSRALLAADSSDGACTAWGAPVELGRVARPDLAELSGLTTSPRQGVLWAVNDSGNSGVLYALAEDGADVAAFAVRGAENQDWEDLALGPDLDSCSSLYIADLGDQEGAREQFTLWRVLEPDLEQGRDRTAAAEEIRLRYPDGAFDAETLLVDPATGEAVVVTKEDGPAGVYAVPGAPPEARDEVQVLERVSTLDLSLFRAEDNRVTGGAVSPGGRRVALRTNEDVFVFDVPEGGGLQEALRTSPERLEAPEGPDGEAITWSADGSALLLGGEGQGSTLWSIPCDAYEPAGAAHALELCESGGCGCGSAGPAGGLAALAALALAAGRRRRLSPGGRAASP